jgi:hypothetical protein
MAGATCEEVSMGEAEEKNSFEKLLRGDVLTSEEVRNAVEAARQKNVREFRAETAILNLNLLNRSVTATHEVTSSTSNLISAIKNFDRSSKALTVFMLILTMVLVLLTIYLGWSEGRALDRQEAILEQSETTAKQEAASLESSVATMKRELDAANRLLNEQKKISDATSGMNAIAQEEEQYTKTVQKQVQSLSTLQPYLGLEVRRVGNSEYVAQIGNGGKATAEAAQLIITAHTGSEVEILCDPSCTKEPVGTAASEMAFVSDLGNLASGDVRRAVIRISGGARPFAVDFTVKAKNFPRSYPLTSEVLP